MTDSAKGAVGAAAGAVVAPASVRRERQRETLLRTFALRVERDCAFLHTELSDGFRSREMMTRLADLERDAAFLVTDHDRIAARRKRS